MIGRYDIGCEPASVDEAIVLEGMAGTFLVFFAVSPIGVDLGVAVLECVDCSATRLGYPNDEGLPEHDRWNDGLGSLDYPIAEVSDSDWVLHLSKQVIVSRNRIWRDRSEVAFAKPSRPLRHFIVLLKEQTFECVAREMKVLGFHSSFSSACSVALSRLGAAE